MKTSELDLDLLKASIEKLVEHHDAFRLRYRQEKVKEGLDKGKIRLLQYYDDKATVEELKVLDLRSLDCKEKTKEFEKSLSSILTTWQCHFDLEHGPLYSVGYAHGFKDGTARVYFALHHLIVDSVSWRILAEDVKTLYLQAESGNTLDLGPKGSSYRQWSDAVASYGPRVRSEDREKDYWSNTLAGIDESNKRLQELINSSIYSTSFSNFVLSKDLTFKLLKESGKAYNTEVNDLLLTALSKSLAEVIGSRVNHITLEGHGREEEISEGKINISRTVGWFTTMYPVRLEVSNTRSGTDENLSTTIKDTKECLRQIPNKGIGFGASIGYDPILLPKISFNYLGQLDQAKDSSKCTGKATDSRGSIWNIVNETSGTSVDSKNHDENIININGFIADGMLQFGVVSKLGSDVTHKLAASFKEKLEEM